MPLFFISYLLHIYYIKNFNKNQLNYFILNALYHSRYISFLFGSFNSVHDRELLEQVKSYTSEKNIYIWFNEEITFSKEIHEMLEEQKSDGNVKFAITSENQPCNSSDVLFPFDKFSSDVLFEDKSRNFYKQCCMDNINVLFDCLKNLKDSLHVEQAEIFVVEGYDDIFQKKVCNIDELKQDLLSQIENNVSIESCIYCVR